MTVSARTEGLNLLVVAAGSFGEQATDRLEAAGQSVNATHVETGARALTRSEQADVDGVIAGDCIDDPVALVERLAGERDLPVVVLSGAGDGTVGDVLDAGATDVFPRTTAVEQFEVVVERFADGPVGRQPYREVFESVSDGLVIHDPETGEMLDVNDRYCELTGYSRAELLGETVGMLTPDDGEHTRERARERIRRAREEGPQLFEWRNQHASGRTYPVEVHLRYLELDGDERVLASVRDITERRRREREYEQIFDMSGDGIVIHDPDSGEVVDANKQVAELLGYDREAFLEQPLSEFQATAEGISGGRAREMVRQTASEGGQEFEWPLETADGETVWVRARHKIGEIGGEERVVALLHDITERKRREREYEQIFNSVRGGITINHPETGEILDANDSFCEQLGYSRDEVLELGVEGVSATDDGFTMDRARELVREVMETGEPRQTEWAVRTSDGERRWLSVRGTPAEIGGEQRYLSLHRDITERKRREREYEQIFNKVTDAIAVFDPETASFVDVNDAYREMLGYDDLETLRELGIEGLSVTEAGYTGERGTDLIREVSETGEHTTVEWQARTRDGERLFLDVTLTPAEIGGERRVLSIQRDVTERRELERAYRDIFENVSDGLVVHDPETGEILDANNRYCELTGYDREELLGETVQLVTSPETDPTLDEASDRLERARTGETELFEFEAERSNGEEFVGEVHFSTIELRGEERVLASVRDITERKRREREYEQVFNSVNDIIAVRDPETGSIVDVNQSYADLLGYDRAEMRGMSIGDVGVPEDGYDQERGMEHLERVMSSDGPVEFEWKVTDADGRTHTMNVQGTDAEINGERRYLAIGRDVTERKRRERAIERLQAATEQLQSAQTTEQVARVAAETAGDVLGLPLAVCWFHDDERDRLDPAAATDAVHDEALVSGLGPDRYEYEVFREGTVTEYSPSERAGENPLETGVLLPLGEHGLVAAGTHEPTDVDGALIDVAKALADHVTTALSRVEREQAVRESERRFRMIAERIDEVIYLAEPDFSEVLYVNPAYEEVYGQPVEAVYDEATAFLDPVDERDRAGFEADFESMLAEIEQGDPSGSYEFEFRVRQPGGAVRWLNATGYLVELSGGTRRFVGIVDDITERKRREQRLEVFNRILRHNLRNQLDVIRSHAEVLADRATDDHAERIIAAVDELAAIGARARNTDRVMSMGDTATEVCLPETIDETVASVRSDRDVTLRTAVPDEASLTTNEQAARTAVGSALENALDHAESTVTVTVDDSPEGYRVTIDDDGPGIPEAELAPIEAGTETTLQHGRGLGLWQLRWSVDRLNGELSFDTTNGTTVRIVIPDQRRSRLTT